MKPCQPTPYGCCCKKRRQCTQSSKSSFPPISKKRQLVLMFVIITYLVNWLLNTSYTYSHACKQAYNCCVCERCILYSSSSCVCIQEMMSQGLHSVLMLVLFSVGCAQITDGNGNTSNETTSRGEILYLYIYAQCQNPDYRKCNQT